MHCVCLLAATTLKETIDLQAEVVNADERYKRAEAELAQCTAEAAEKCLDDAIDLDKSPGSPRPLGSPARYSSSKQRSTSSIRLQQPEVRKGLKEAVQTTVEDVVATLLKSKREAIFTAVENLECAERELKGKMSAEGQDDAFDSSLQLSASEALAPRALLSAHPVAHR